MGVVKDKNGIWVSENKNGISYPEIGNKDSFDLENSSFWFNHRNNIIEKVIKKIPFENDFADIGGGNGYQLMRIAKNNTSNKNILIEPGYDGCLNARSRKLNDVYNMTFEDFNFDQFIIGGVSMFDVIEHIEDDVTFMKRLAEKLKPGNKVYLTVPTHNYLWSDIDHYGGHFRRYNRKMIYELAKKSGYTVEYFSYFFSYLMPISYLLRALPYKLGKRITEEQIISNEREQHNPRGIVKGLFELFEKRELKKIEKGSIDNGASCIFVLRK